jgi:molybdopterin-binding protein
VPQLRIREAAELLGVSDDTVRRWADHGRIRLVRASNGRSVVEGADLAVLARELADAPTHASGARSARNSLRGIVTKVTRDTVMAQVEMQAGPFRVVSLMSREAADELALEVGTVAFASIKATNVVIEVDKPHPRRRPAAADASQGPSPRRPAPRKPA